jgi:DeoR family suf operon transcriptional repressor
MAEGFVTSDTAILDLLRKREPLSISELSTALEVTATAVRQRLTRLMAQGYIERTTARAGRGRPSHAYGLTAAGRRKTGSNFTDLAVALWQEVRAIKDGDIRRGLLARISQRLAADYAGQISGDSTADRMRSLAALFGERQVPFDVIEEPGKLPVLQALACPYPELAEQDKSICAMERMMFSDLLGENVHLEQCRLDGAKCCTFEVSIAMTGEQHGSSTANVGDGVRSIVAG